MFWRQIVPAAELVTATILELYLRSSWMQTSLQTQDFYWKDPAAVVSSSGEWAGSIVIARSSRMGSRGAATLVLLILSCVVSGVVCAVEDGLPRPRNFPDEPTVTYGPTPQLTDANGLASDCQWYGWANSLYDAATGTECLDILRKALTNATVNPPSSLKPYQYYTIKRLIDPATNQSYCYQGCFILTQAPAQSPLGGSMPPFASPPEPLTDAPSPLGDSMAPTPQGDSLPPGDAYSPSPLGGDGLSPTPLGDSLAPTPGVDSPPAPLAPTPGVDSPMATPPPLTLSPAGSPPAPAPAPSDPVNEPLPSPSPTTPTTAPPPPSRSFSPPAPPVMTSLNGATSVAPSAFVSWLLVGGALLLNLAGR